PSLRPYRLLPPYPILPPLPLLPPLPIPPRPPRPQAAKSSCALQELEELLFGEDRCPDFARLLCFGRGRFRIGHDEVIELRTDGGKHLSSVSEDERLELLSR